MRKIEFFANLLLVVEVNDSLIDLFWYHSNQTWTYFIYIWNVWGYLLASRWTIQIFHLDWFRKSDGVGRDEFGEIDMLNFFKKMSNTDLHSLLQTTYYGEDVKVKDDKITIRSFREGTVTLSFTHLVSFFGHGKYNAVPNGMYPKCRNVLFSVFIFTSIGN